MGFKVTNFLKPVLVTLATLAGKVVAPHKVSLANLAQIPLTVAGLSCIDVAFFQLGSFAGWLATGISLLALESMIADEGGDKK